MDDWLWATAAELGRGIAAGEIAPEDLAEAYLAAIARHPDAERIYARVTPDRARAEAAAAGARARAGLRRGPLDGVPISWKDLFDTAGVATEAGTALMRGRVPARDAEVLRRATDAGLVCLGKTHMSEIAFSGLGLNPVTATPPNRHDPDAVPGGSSSGAAASVAFGLAAAGIGSDTGGSVRIPAAWNDLVGFKTTHGLLPLDGVVPLCSGFDTVGPLCRSVEDAALLWEALGGGAVDLRGTTLDGTRMAVLDTVVGEDLDPGIAAAFDAALGRLSDAGVAIERIAWPPLAEAYEIAGPLVVADAWANWRRLVEVDPDAMFDQIRARVSAGAAVPAHVYLENWSRLRALRGEYAAATAGFDAVLCPTTAGPAPKVAALLADPELYVAENLRALRNTRLGNLMGLCGLTLPTGVPGAGLLLNGAARGEARLLRLGVAAARALT